MKKIIVLIALVGLTYYANAKLVLGGEVAYRHTFGGGPGGYNYTNLLSVHAYGTYNDITVEISVIIIRCLNPGWEACPQIGDAISSGGTPTVDNLASANLEIYANEQLDLGINSGTTHRNYLDPVTNKVMSYTLNWLKDEEGVSIQVKRDGLTF